MINETHESNAPMPQLAYPFAVVGAAAGWVGAGVVGEPFFSGEDAKRQGLTAAIAFVNAAVVGLVLTRWCANRNPFAGAHALWMRVVALVLLAGAITGALTEQLNGGTRLLDSGAFGAVAAIGFL